jgi:hypothetical protein
LTFIDALAARSLVPKVVVHDPWPGSSTKMMAPGMCNCCIFASSRGWSLAVNAGTPTVGVTWVVGALAEEQAETTRQTNNHSAKTQWLMKWRFLALIRAPP